MTFHPRAGGDQNRAKCETLVPVFIKIIFNVGCSSNKSKCKAVSHF